MGTWYVFIMYYLGQREVNFQKNMIFFFKKKTLILSFVICYIIAE